VAIPVAAYLTLLGAVHGLVATEKVIRPAAIVCCVAGVLLLPLAAARIGVAGVVAGIAAICVVLVAVTIAARNR